MLIERLQKQTGLTRSQIDRYADTASKRYKSYPIPKRTGGIRIIHQPTPEIKAIQRWINRALFRTIPTHKSSTAYSRGSSIRENADRHKRTIFTIRVDFESYFPSFRTDGVDRFLRDANRIHDLGLNEDDVSFVKKMVLRNGELTIGAPSSPHLTNIMMYKFDDEVENWCLNRDLVYTRYADDLYISSREAGKLDDVIPFVEEIISEYPYVELKINQKKTSHLSRRYRRSITGLILTPAGQVSIGRQRKRLIRSLVHEYAIGKLDADQIPKLQGLMAFAFDAEPHFYGALMLKHGSPLLDKLRVA